MSYILDALQRADAERARGTVPGLHTRQTSGPALAPTPATGKRLWPAVVAAVALCVGATLWWLWPTAGHQLRLAGVAPAVVQAPVPAPAAPAQSVLAAPTPSVSASASAVAPAPQPTAPALPSTRQPEPVAAAAKPAASTPIQPAPLAKAAPAPTGPSAAPLLSELSEDLRRQIPALTITGAVYAENPARRLLLVNNQVLAQGSQAAPEVTLEEIQAKSSVFSFRGTRFRLAH